MAKLNTKKLVAEEVMASEVNSYMFGGDGGNIPHFYKCIEQAFPSVPKAYWVEWLYGVVIPGTPKNSLDKCKKAMIEIIGKEVYDDMEYNGLDMIFEWLIGYSDGAGLKIDSLVKAIKKVNPTFKKPKRIKADKLKVSERDVLSSFAIQLDEGNDLFQNLETLKYFFELVGQYDNIGEWSNWLKTGEKTKVVDKLIDKNYRTTATRLKAFFKKVFPCFNID